MVGAMARKLLGGVLGLATNVAKHVAWYVAHQFERQPRERD
jgi:hypothetical protein